MKCLTSETHGGEEGNCLQISMCCMCTAISVGLKSLLKDFVTALHPFLKIKCKKMYSYKAMCVQTEEVAPFV